MIFHDSPANNHTVTARDLTGLVDAFTGEALNSTLGLFQCGKCQVYYHRASFELIRSENAGRCVACLSSSINLISSTETKPEAWRRQDSPPPRREGFFTGDQSATSSERTREQGRTRTHELEAVTLSNHREHVGRVVSFTGRAAKVVKSRSGKDYAVMFEDKDWCDGFKMVILRRPITKFGGGAFLKSLAGRTIFARGLLQRHHTFGYLGWTPIFRPLDAEFKLLFSRGCSGCFCSLNALRLNLHWKERATNQRSVALPLRLFEVPFLTAEGGLLARPFRNRRGSDPLE